MKMISPFIVGAAILLVSASVTKAVSGDDQAARDEALRWENLIDSSHYQQAYEEQAPRIKAGSMGKEFFVKWLNTHRTPLGRARTRQFFEVKHSQHALGWPDGNYEQISFKSSFEHKATAVEVIILTKETGSWRPAGYKLY